MGNCKCNNSFLPKQLEEYFILTQTLNNQFNYQYQLISLINRQFKLFIKVYMGINQLFNKQYLELKYRLQNIKSPYIYQLKGLFINQNNNFKIIYSLWDNFKFWEQQRLSFLQYHQIINVFAEGLLFLRQRKMYKQNLQFKSFVKVYQRNGQKYWKILDDIILNSQSNIKKFHLQYLNRKLRKIYICPIQYKLFFEKKTYNSQKSLIFILGMLILHSILQKQLFYIYSQNGHINQESLYNIMKDMNQNINDIQLIQKLRHMIQINQQKRISVQGLVKNQFRLDFQPLLIYNEKPIVNIKTYFQLNNKKTQTIMKTQKNYKSRKIQSPINKLYKDSPQIFNSIKGQNNVTKSQQNFQNKNQQVIDLINRHKNFLNSKKLFLHSNCNINDQVIDIIQKRPFLKQQIKLFQINQYIKNNQNHSKYTQNNQITSSQILLNTIKKKQNIIQDELEKQKQFQKIIQKNGNVYKGYVINGKKNGIGQYNYGNYKYQGNWLNNKKHGFGNLFQYDQLIYCGQFFHNQYHGYGQVNFLNPKAHSTHKILNYQNSEYYQKYQGKFKNGKMQGIGTLIYNDGTIYVGDFKNDKPDGFGTIKHPYEQSFSGKFKDGKLQYNIN